MNAGDKIRTIEQVGSDLGLNLKAGSVGKVVMITTHGVNADFDGQAWFLYHEQYETLDLPELEEFRSLVPPSDSISWRHVFAGLSMNAQIMCSGSFDADQCLKDADSLLEVLGSNYAD